MANIDTGSTTKKPIEKKEKQQAKFDLSDGIQKEDFIAIGSSLFHAVVFILRIIFYPLIWIWRELKRLSEFLSARTGRPLTDDEILFLSSWPIFLSTIGITLGAILGLFTALYYTQNLSNKLSSIGTFFSWLGGLIKGIYDVCVIIIVFIWGLLVELKNFVFNDIFKSTDITIPFITVAIIGFIGAIIVLFILESKLFAAAIQKIHNLYFYIISLPRRIFNYLDRNIWKGAILVKIGRPFVGAKTLGTHINLIYKKILYATIAFSALAFVTGVTLFVYGVDKASADPTSTYRPLIDPVIAATFLIIVFLIAGVIAGFVGTFIFTKFLMTVGGTKYRILTPEMVPEATITSTSTIKAQPVRTGAKSTDKTSKVSETVSTPAPVPVITPGMTAKERAEARKKAREELKKTSH